MYRIVTAFCFVLLTFSVHAETEITAPSIGALENLIEKTRQEWKVPGASVAIIRGDQPLLVKGFGLRDVERKKPVTEKTLFRIGSVTKSFTAAGVAALATQGKLDWNKPVRTYLPEFQLHTDALTAQVTPVDLLSHRTGLPRHDSIWYFNRDFTRADLVRRLRYMEPNKPLRETWQYNNFMFMTAGWLTGRILGTSWEDAVRKLIFKPLRMNATNTSLKEMESNRDHARPYREDKQGNVQLLTEYYNSEELAPAGMINSTAVEMGRYVTMLMNGGMFEGRQVLAKADVQKMTTAQMVVGPADPRYSEIGDSSYGLALSITSYRGHRMIHHGGAIDGFRAHMVFLPDDKLGIVVLSNLGGVSFVTALSHDLFDRLLGLPPANFSERNLEDKRRSKAARDEAESKGYSTRKPGTKPSHAVADYVGFYEHPGYGTVRVTQAGDGLQIQYGFLKTPLNHFHYDSFEFVTNPVSQDKLTLRFATGEDGEVESLSAPLEPLVAPIVFARVADPQMRTREFLLPLAGQYQLGPSVVEVVLRDDNVLKLVQPTGLAFELEPTRGTTFRVKDRAGWFLEFKPAGGAVNEAVLHVPGSSSVLKRKP